MELRRFSFEDCKRLKALGFDERCSYYYTEEGNEIACTPDMKNSYGVGYTNPSVALVKKWLEAEKGLILEILYEKCLTPDKIHWGYIWYEATPEMHCVASGYFIGEGEDLEHRAVIMALDVLESDAG